MVKQSSNKPFFIMPEWAWAIFVALFMLLLFLNHVIPGHASTYPSVLFNDLGNRGNNILFLSVQGSKIYAGSTFIVDYSVLDSSADPEDAKQSFKADALVSLNSLSSFFPSAEFFVSIADNGASLSAMDFLLSILDESSVSFGELLEVPDNFIELYTSHLYSLGQFMVNVWSRNVPLAPTPTPEPSRPYYFVMYYRPYGGYDSIGYYIVKVEGISVGGLVPVVSSPVFDAVSSAYSVDSPFRGFVFLGYPSIDSGSMYVYFGGFQVSVSYAFLGSSLPSGTCEDIASGKTFSMLSNSRSMALITNSNGLNCLRIQYSADNFVMTGFYKFDVPSYKYSSPSKWSTSSVFDANDVDVLNPYYQALIYGLTGDIAPTPNPEGPQPTSTPSPSPSPVPLPTSGESVHVILPTGTPSPTPPFSVPGGSNGDPGSGSPGSVGSGISASQSSGILSYFSSFLSNNPALAFIAACFPAIPSELLYPLFVLLFILMILAAIRLFVHFAGG